MVCRRSKVWDMIKDNEEPRDARIQKLERDCASEQHCCLIRKGVRDPCSEGNIASCSRLPHH